METGLDLIDSLGDVTLTWDEMSSLLLSPPREWPACFELPPLASFVSDALLGKRVRACGGVSEANAAKIAGIEFGEDSRANAERVRAKTGWDILSGYAVYERSDIAAPDGSPAFVGRPFWWNVKKNGAWVDATPRGPLHAGELVLVESDRVPLPPPLSVEELKKEKKEKREKKKAQEEGEDTAPIDPMKQLYRDQQREMEEAAEKMNRKVT